VDLTNSGIIQFATLGLDGLAARHKAIISNIANADTPGYKRMDVSFEDQLGKIIQTEDAKESIKLQNSAVESTSQGAIYAAGNTPLRINHNQDSLQIADFNPKFGENTDNPANKNGNTVNIEQEMSSLTKNGMEYDALATMQSKEFRILTDIIKQ